MDINEIKKALYRKKPTAHIVDVSKKGIRYRADLYQEEQPDLRLYFIIPLSDMGDAVFWSTAEAHLLIRYLITQ